MKQKTKKTLAVLAILGAISPLGCSTQEVRGSNASVPTTIYPAIRNDCEMIVICYDGSSIFNSGGPVAKMGGYTVVPLCWIIDMPLSAITDTVCLPKDLWRLNRGTNSLYDEP